MPEDNAVIKITQSWIDKFIIGRSICPFAKHIPRGKLRLEIDSSSTLSTNLENLSIELERLKQNRDIETTLIIYPNADKDFLVFLDLYYACNQLIEDLDLIAEYQLVSFHPTFRFDNENPDDSAHFTNRSPYPMIHILRESSVTKAVDTHPDVDSIPERNMAYLRNKPSSYWEGMEY